VVTPNCPSRRRSLNHRAIHLKHLLLTGDDFGRSHEVNESIERYFAAGALTQASLMVNEMRVEEAVEIARRSPGLCVGLHLTLCDGSAARLSHLTDRRGRLDPLPSRAGWQYAIANYLDEDLSAEIERQFARFHSFGLAPAYWDGHHHLHLHPKVLRLTLPIAQRYGFRVMRTVREPFPWRPTALIFSQLSRRAARKMAGGPFATVDRTYGLSRSGRLTEANVRRIAQRLPAGWSELYFHPGAERAALRPEHLAEIMEGSGIQLADSVSLAMEKGIGEAAPAPLAAVAAV
jgi:predicted glycoside hydrolase/deacetylase ChbG (UPF0249 family)